MKRFLVKKFEHQTESDDSYPSIGYHQDTCQTYSTCRGRASLLEVKLSRDFVVRRLVRGNRCHFTDLGDVSGGRWKVVWLQVMVSGDFSYLMTLVVCRSGAFLCGLGVTARIPLNTTRLKGPPCAPLM